MELSESPDQVNRKRHHRNDRPGIRRVNFGCRQLLLSDGQKGETCRCSCCKPGIHTKNACEITYPQHGQRQIKETAYSGQMRVVKSLDEGPGTGFDAKRKTIEHFRREPEPSRDSLCAQFRVMSNQVDIPALRPEIHDREMIGGTIPGKIRFERHLDGREKHQRRGHAHNGDRQAFAPRYAYNDIIGTERPAL